MRNNYNQGTAQPRRVDSVPRVSEVTGGQMDQNGVYRANRQQAPAAPQRQGKGAAQPRQAKQPKPARPAAPAPAREPESGAPLNGLLLPIIAGALAVVGTLLLVVGVFLLKDPEPRVVTDTPSQSISRQDTDGEEPKDTTPAGEENQSAEPAEGDDSQPADGEESQPAEGDGSQPADGEDGQPADDSADGQDTASTDAQPADEGDGDQPQAHGKVRPLTSVQFGPAEDSTAADGEDEGLVDTTPSEPSGEGEPDSSAAEPSEEEQGNDAAEPSSEGEPAQEGDTEPAREDDTEPAPEGDAAPEEQPEAPAPDRTDRQEEGGINIVKLVVTLLGMLMLLAGAVLGIVSNLLQRRELTESQERAASLEREIADMKARTREPTTEEKLRYAFQQIPVLTEAQSNAMMREAAAQTAAHRNVQPPIQQNRPAAPVDPVEKSNAYYNSLLAGGAQKATQAMLGNPEYLGASIDIANSLNAYQAGQRAAYHVIQVEKDPNAPYLTCVKGGSPVALYPNPYAVQYLGIAKLQSMQFILEAFRVVARGAEITPQTLDGLDGLQIRRVEGAAMDARGIVTRKGVIELG